MVMRLLRAGSLVLASLSPAAVLGQPTPKRAVSVAVGGGRGITAAGESSRLHAEVGFDAWRLQLSHLIGGDRRYGDVVLAETAFAVGRELRLGRVRVLPLLGASRFTRSIGEASWFLPIDVVTSSAQAVGVYGAAELGTRVVGPLRAGVHVSGRANELRRLAALGGTIAVRL